MFGSLDLVISSIASSVALDIMENQSDIELYIYTGEPALWVFGGRWGEKDEYATKDSRIPESSNS